MTELRRKAYESLERLIEDKTFRQELHRIICDLTIDSLNDFDLYYQEAFDNWTDEYLALYDEYMSADTIGEDFAEGFLMLQAYSNVKASIADKKLLKSVNTSYQMRNIPHVPEAND